MLRQLVSILHSERLETVLGFFVRNNVNLCFGLTSSLPLPSFLRTLPNAFQTAWRKPSLLDQF